MSKICKKLTQLGRGHRDTSPKKARRWPADTWGDGHHHQSLGKGESKPQWDVTSHLQWLLSKSQKLTRWWGHEEKETWALLAGLETGTVIRENSINISQRTEDRFITWSSNFTCRYLSEESKTLIFKNICVCVQSPAQVMSFLLQNLLLHTYKHVILWHNNITLKHSTWHFRWMFKLLPVCVRGSRALLSILQQAYLPPDPVYIVQVYIYTYICIQYIHTHISIQCVYIHIEQYIQMHGREKEIGLLKER